MYDWPLKLKVTFSWTTDRGLEIWSGGAGAGFLPKEMHMMTEGDERRQRLGWLRSDCSLPRSCKIKLCRQAQVKVKVKMLVNSRGRSEDYFSRGSIPNI